MKLPLLVHLQGSKSKLIKFSFFTRPFWRLAPVSKVPMPSILRQPPVPSTEHSKGSIVLSLFLFNPSQKTKSLAIRSHRKVSESRLPSQIAAVHVATKDGLY